MAGIEVPDFKTGEDFEKLVKSLDEKQIQQWTTADWNKMYDKLDAYVATEDFTKTYTEIGPSLCGTARARAGNLGDITLEQLLSAQKNPVWRKIVFTEVYARQLGKLYRNYRFEPEQSAYIRQMGREFGERLANEGYVDTAKLAITSAGYENGSFYLREDELWKMTRKADDIVLEGTSYGRTPETGYVHTDIEIINDASFGGIACGRGEGRALTQINSEVVRDWGMTAAYHEAIHTHNQGKNVAHAKAASQGILAHPELGEDFQHLMSKNIQYYLTPESAVAGIEEEVFYDNVLNYKTDYVIQRTGFRGYRSQPVERYSQIGGLEAERAFRRETGQSSERTAMKVADYIEGKITENMPLPPGFDSVGRPQDVSHTPDGVKLVYRTNGNFAVEELEGKIKARFAGADESLLKDLNISADSTFGKVSVTVPTTWDFSKKWKQFTSSTPPMPPVVNWNVDDGLELVDWDDGQGGDLDEVRYGYNGQEGDLQEINWDVDDVSSEEAEARAIAAQQKARQETEEKALRFNEQAGQGTFSLAESEMEQQSSSTTKVTTEKAEEHFNRRVTERTAENAATKQATKRGVKEVMKEQASNAGEKLLRMNAQYDKWFDDAVAGVMKWNMPSGVKNAALKIDNAAGKVIDNKATRLAKAKLDRAAAAFAKTEAGKKIQKKLAATAAKMGGEAALKSLAKKIPLLSLAIGLYYGGERLLNGQFVKAAGEVLSGAAGCVPVYGTAVSLGIDGAMLADDLKEAGINMSAKEAVALLGESISGGQIHAQHNPYVSESTNVSNPYKKLHEQGMPIKRKTPDKDIEETAKKEAAESMRNIDKFAYWRQGR